MKEYDGPVLGGNWDEEEKAFTLMRVKQLSVQCVLSERQFQQLQHYLNNQDDDRTVYITLYDQIPVMVHPDERSALCEDMNQISSYWL
ncbi:hypothetical protein [Alkalihalobacillus sp. AL-G]|uniref:hypothetical protein n=1 Tax=Alkalihalobacillus sp. AL-G TaxID=2926399 RepID=UPI00272B09F2|nr:hypothetical protein [Alkalihalobacillus sp. AL-G]WLD91781.1 hypothetical protein MOJ78_12105 [Alkalihalobacillus sp. AL-G]